MVETILYYFLLIPFSVIFISENAFYEWSSPIEIKNPSSFNAIGKNAFNSCINLYGKMTDDKNCSFKQDFSNSSIERFQKQIPFSIDSDWIWINFNVVVMLI